MFPSLSPSQAILEGRTRKEKYLKNPVKNATSEATKSHISPIVEDTGIISLEKPDLFLGYILPFSYEPKFNDHTEILLKVS